MPIFAEKINIMTNTDSNKLVTDNLGYVVSIAKEYRDRGLSMDDLVSEGTMGMLQASKKFDSSKGKRFVSYAAGFIRESIEQAIAQQTGLYRIPKNEESKTEQRRAKAVSVDSPIPAGRQTNFTLLSVLEDKNAGRADDDLMNATVSDRLQRALNALDERERYVVASFYGIGRPHLTMMEIAQEHGLKRERVRQIRDKAVRKLKKQL